MWFKNLTLFRVTPAFAGTPEELADALAESAFRPCGALEPHSFGWSPPLGRRGSTLVHAAERRMLVCARHERRVLPPSVVREEVEERVARIQSGEGREVRAGERRRIRDAVHFELLPRAFTRSDFDHAYLDGRAGWLVIDSASVARTDDLLSLLAPALSGYRVEPFTAAESPAARMTAWLQGEVVPEGFELGDECELRDPREEGALVRCRRQDLAAEEIRAHLRAGKQVHRLALEFDGRIRFLLGSDLGVRRLRFADLEAPDRDEPEDEVARFDADFALMSGELARLLARLEAVFPPPGAG